MVDQRPRDRATVADVADAAGVSSATASKALNGRKDVAEATRERVLAAASELGYRPDALGMPARNAVAIVFDVPASPYILNVFQGVLGAATEHGVELLTRLAPPLEARQLRAAASDWVSAQTSVGARGIIGITLSEPDALIEAAAAAGLPFIMVDPVDTRHHDMISVGSSNWAGARAATEHLIGLGHRRIAWVGGPEASTAARDRFYGFQAACNKEGIGADDAMVSSGWFTVASGRERALELLDAAEPPTAIMAADDELAVGVLRAAHERSVRVPEALSVTGFDDTPQAQWTTPELSTVHQHLDDMGRVAVQTVLAMADGRPPASRHLELATSLTIRSTTAPPA
ncbi:MAG: LacI family DNA-binding transcriptional regulator [Microbacterium sp.]